MENLWRLATAPLDKSEERHGFKVKKKLGTPIHMQKSWQSLALYNSKRAGHVTPLRLKKKSDYNRSPRNIPPFSKRFLEKYPNVLELHNILNKKIYFLLIALNFSAPREPKYAT